MPDTPSAWDLDRRIRAAERLCEHRAKGHVDRELYASESAALRRDLDRLDDKTVRMDVYLADRQKRDEQIVDLEREVTDLRRDLAAEGEMRAGAVKAIEDARIKARRWIISAFVAPPVVAVVTVLVGRVL